MKNVVKIIASLFLTSAVANAETVDLSNWILEMGDYGGITQTETSLIFEQGAYNIVRSPEAFDGDSISFSVSGNTEVHFVAGFVGVEDDFLIEFKLQT